MEVEHHVFFERLWVPHYAKTMFPKSESLQSLMTSYFQNGRLVKRKNASYLLNDTFFVTVAIINRNV